MAEGLAALRLLVVDDNPQMRTIVGTVLKAAGIRDLHYAPNGRVAWHGLAEIKPDICFVDYEMPVMNGLDFLSIVRGLNSPLRFMPVIMLTGHSDELRLTAARDRGVNEFLAKPVSARTILMRLHAVIMRPRPFVTSESYFGPDRRRRTTPSFAGPFRRAEDRVPDRREVFEL
ncbi:response regulator [Phenylobacterium kunshanense]|uniref:Response regulator n=1 Tax=Phenylobacterium kunshanense TaxID=1445034 RepID=A0A328BEB6_9CAUL|nr:response regulator [Phenylobacterium kunshanense]RAK64216.1 response regulator [Phenylobacterium kunshanense]